jgi:hypothetical protein
MVFLGRAAAKGIPAQRLEDDLAQLETQRRMFRQLPVALDARSLVAHGGAAIDPAGAVQLGTNVAHLVGAEDFGMCSIMMKFSCRE